MGRAGTRAGRAAAVWGITAGALVCATALAQGAVVIEAAVLQAELEASTAAPDIAMLAQAYVARAPSGPAAVRARRLLEQARRAEAALGRLDSPLAEPSAEQTTSADRRAAALGDAEAAMRVARLQQREAELGRAGADSYLGWLQYAALLGHEAAGYELALHYRNRGQAALAAKYESQALVSGRALVVREESPQ